MVWSFPNRCGLLRFLASFVLVFGLAGSAWLYLDAGNQAADTVRIDEESGLEGGLHPEDIKAYSRDMEGIGGKIWLLLPALRRWFVSLWQGRSLAVIVAGASVVAAMLLFHAAGRTETRQDHNAPGRP